VRKTEEQDTPTRRSALKLSISAIAAGLAAPALAMAAPASPDAELIKLCNDLVAANAEIEALCATRKTIADEHRTEQQLELLSQKHSTIEAAIEEQGSPETAEGVRAMACVAMTRFPGIFEGEPIAHDFDEWVTLCVVEFVAGGALA